MLQHGSLQLTPSHKSSIADAGGLGVGGETGQRRDRGASGFAHGGLLHHTIAASGAREVSGGVAQDGDGTLGRVRDRRAIPPPRTANMRIIGEIGESSICDPDLGADSARCDASGWGCVSQSWQHY